ncbi:MAG: transglycosylase domain-containing protein [Bacteriovoracaceae bacterium]|nr:transglycosylase domain-containing protein [Bacteriovoracaceae bacterium]
MYGPIVQIRKLASQFIWVSSDQERARYSIEKKRSENWIKLSELNFKATHAIVVSEDWSFYEHFGVDIKQIYVALKNYLMGKSKRLRGASTITQQVVKNLFLSNERSFSRKFKEVLLAFFMDLALKKEKILEIYLNIVEFGDGIYGVKKASYHYFQKHPTYLAPREMAFLAMILPSPQKNSSSFRDKKLSLFAKSTLDSIIHKLKVAKYLTAAEKALELKRKFSWEWY